MTFRLPIAVGVVAAVLALGWYALGPIEDPPPAEPLAAARDERLPAGPHPGGAARAATSPRTYAPPARAIAVRHTLFNEYLAARQYRSIYDRLRASAEGTTAEGRLVLYEILRNCATITEPRRYNYRPPQPKRDEFVAGLAASDPQRDRRIAAYDNFTANRCVGFEGVSLSQAELDRLLHAAAAAGDPRARAMAMEQELWQTRRTRGRDLATLTDTQIDDLKQIVATRDPEAIRVAGRVLANTWADYALRIGPEQQPVEQRPFMNAWLVLACEYGQPCGADTPRMLQACALHGHCNAQTYPDYLAYYSSSPHDSQMVLQYRGLIRQAIESGDWSQFSVVRGLPSVNNRLHFVPGPR